MGLIERLRGDAACLSGVYRTLKMTKPVAQNPTRVLPDVMTELAATHGDRPALISDRETFTYRELGARANRYAHWAVARGIRKGDTICLLMPNRPEFMAIWLGLTQAGGVVALLNINLSGASLAHCINVVTPSHVIAASELLDVLATAYSQIKGDVKFWRHGSGSSDLPRIDQEIAEMPSVPLAQRPALTTEDRALYIYTSGTTGLPKAANMNHYRLMLAVHGFAGIMDTRSTDRMYDCLPMYHTVGGLVATGAVLVRGGSVVIRDKFSAHQFWDDVVRFECTLVQYIGELCRYLVNSPPSANETKHRLRLVCGNGLRPDVWPQFKQRFRIPRVLEFYAATEGNVSLINFEGKEGSVGRIPWFLAKRLPTKLLKFNLDAEQPFRDANGFCIECAPGEVGEAIGQILNDPTKPGSRFEGYATTADNERKILRNAFVAGDAWFRTGDLMRKDKGGYFYFVDRIGDTFRWKGENVSTFEVSEAITGAPGVIESTVYGVKVPGSDGRAGMVALVTGKEFSLPEFRAHVVRRLPTYARPLFVRIQSALDVTATFKQRKVNLVRQGFDPVQISDPMFFHDVEQEAFIPLDTPLYQRIAAGEIRL